ncbi:hypothetical protein ES703_58975 [subsurface metagenome]
MSNSRACTTKVRHRGFLGPTIGGIIADVDASLPFTSWAGVLIISIITFSLIKGKHIGNGISQIS